MRPNAAVTARSSSNTITVPSATGSNLTPSSSPEPGTSPHGLAAHGWQSFIDEKDEKWNITSDEGVRLIDKEDDGDDDEDDDEDEEEENKSSDDDKYTGDVNSDDSIDIFTVTKDQLKYYCEQFTKLTGCTDKSYSCNSLVNGTLAKEFFEKSKLPVEDLSKIWILSDQDKDGSLKLVEFCIAMHLVVLRRNSVDLPSTLPPNLLVSCNRVITNYPDKCLKSTSDALLFDPLGSSPVTEKPANATSSNASQSLLGREQPPSQSHQTRQQYPPDINNSTATSWTRFSPTSPILNSPNSLNYQAQQQLQQPATQLPCNVTVVSDGNSSSNEATPAPVNFDFQPVSMLDRDPKVIHPIARRLTPEVPQVSNCVNGISPLKFPLPPPPPPRTSHRHSKHARSSSLDLNHMSRGSSVSSHYLPPHTSSSLLTSPTESSFNSLNHSSCNFNRKPLPTPPPPQQTLPPPSASLPMPQCSSSSSTPSGGSILHSQEPHQGAFTIVRKRVTVNNGNKNNTPILSSYTNANLTAGNNSECKSPSSNPSTSNFYVASTGANATCSAVAAATSSSNLLASSSTVVPTSNNNTNGNTSTSIQPNESDCYNNDTLDTLLLLKSKYSLPRQSFIPSNPNDHSELIRCMKGLSDRAMRLEKLNEQLIEEMITVIRQNQHLESMISQMTGNKW